MQNKINYCLSCPIKPCTKGCPLNNDITGFIKLLKEDRKEEAYKLLSETTVLPAVCSRICPHDKQCQGSCVRGIKSTPVSIGEIESYLADYALENDLKYSSEPSINKKVCIIGGGPAGLTCAAFLKRNGVDVTIYEKHQELGGILSHGIPEFRLDRSILEKTIKNITDLGIEVKLNQELGKDFLVEDILDKYDAIFLGIGANISGKMNIPGEDLQNVYGANECLEYNNIPEVNDKICVVSGGGNVAMDIARTLNRKGAKTYVIYRRSKNEMPAEIKEIEDATNEGVMFMYQTNILNISGDKKVDTIECIKTELIQKEGESRLTPVNIEGSNFKLQCDYVFMAVGSKTEKDLIAKLNLETDKRGKIITNNCQTSNPKIFAGGDVTDNISTVAWASRSGRDAAYAILEYLKTC